ncbi:MAG: class I SAM-dependent methyltransferase [Planctomycetota bacterium]
MSIVANPYRCCFCESVRVRKSHSGVYHPFVKSHGPFDFYICEDCGSGLTLPPPAPEVLLNLYQSFESGMPEFHREIMQDTPQTALYSRCIRSIARFGKLTPNTRFIWLDVGAGGGELSDEMLRKYPLSHGIGVDLHEPPDLLIQHLVNKAGRFSWVRANINDADFIEKAKLHADVVISTAVWEHVIAPDIFIKNLISAMGPGGLLYLMCPDYGSLARRVMKTKWHYFSPGEHLNVPTRKGARICIERAWAKLNASPAKSIISRPLLLPYTIRYTLKRFGMNSLGRLVPASWFLPLPAGALEAVLVAE